MDKTKGLILKAAEGSVEVLQWPAFVQHLYKGTHLLRVGKYSKKGREKMVST